MSNTTQTELGSLLSLWRYPVKSMQGEELNASAVTQRGLLGDRAYALIDRTDGKVATAKNPGKWPRLFDFRASFVDAPSVGAKIPALRITLPDGTHVTTERNDLNQILSQALQRDVTFQVAERGEPDPRLLTSWKRS
jgi:uncharacterized protein